MNRKPYDYVYRQGDRKCLGTSCHESDKEAIDYYRSLEGNGQIKMSSLKSNGSEIWESTITVRRLPFNKTN